MSLATLTVTVYMIVQGIAPSFWGSFSDVLGRRSIFIGTFIVYMISNIALGVSKNYAQLMAFRAIQAAGSAATISIGMFPRLLHIPMTFSNPAPPQVLESSVISPRLLSVEV
jgi:MFS family permease